MDQWNRLPELFAQRLQSIVPSHCWDQVRNSFLEEKSTSFRINRLLTDRATVLSQLEPLDISVTAVPWFSDALEVANCDRSRLTHCILAEEGHIYLHNLSSMTAVLMLDPQPEEAVLDLAAAPGGKTLHIAAAMNGTGALSAVEVVKGRFFKLKENLRRGGADYVRTFRMDGREVAAKTGQRFDRVLLDAPCSGEARFRPDDPTSFQFWGDKKISECKRKQRGLIKSAFRSLKVGGTLLYSTCSFAPEENEGVVSDLLKKFPQAQMLPLDLPFDSWQEGVTQWNKKRLDPAVEQCRRILPNRSLDGLFLAKILKTDSTS